LNLSLKIQAFISFLNMQIKIAEFITSAANLSQCPVSQYPEFAFFWRSNVGKSSLINGLTQRKNLAKASKIPWKTRLFNFFLINKTWQLVDLPWYGYAKVTDNEKTRWLDTTHEFLLSRKNLKQLFLLIDISVPPQKIDLQMAQTLLEENIPYTLVFTKIDKISQKELNKNLKEFQKIEKETKIPFSKAFFVSNTKGKGRKELLDFIDGFLCL